MRGSEQRSAKEFGLSLEGHEGLCVALHTTSGTITAAMPYA